MKRKVIAISILLSIILVVVTSMLIKTSLDLGRLDRVLVDLNGTLYTRELEHTYEDHRFNTAKDSIRDLQGDYQALTETTYDIALANDLLTKELELVDIRIGYGRALDASAVMELESMGIRDPNILAEDLLNHSEIIELVGFYKNSMTFHKVYILNEKYAYADMYDGVKEGYGIYRYYIDEDLNIEWEIVLEDTIGSGDYDLYLDYAYEAYIVDDFLGVAVFSEGNELGNYMIEFFEMVDFAPEIYHVMMSYVFDSSHVDIPLADLIEEGATPMLHIESDFYRVIEFVTMELIDGEYVMTNCEPFF